MELRPRTEKRLPSLVDVAIIGGGIAGLSLARALVDIQKGQETKLHFALFEERGESMRQDKFYLCGEYISSYGKLADEYLTSQQNSPAVPRISGVKYFSKPSSDKCLKTLANLTSLPDKGYVPVPQSILQRSLIKGTGEDDMLKDIYYDTKINTLETNDQNTILHTSQGAVTCRIVIDCTGMNQAILEKTGKVAKDYKVCGTYGGITSVRGIKSNYLYFIRGLPSNSSNGIFPIKVHNSETYVNAEVVVANDMDKSGLSAWYQSSDTIFEDM